MNVYDFDGTIYSGDSTIDFFVFCLLRRPRVLCAFGKQITGVAKYKVGKISKTEFKETFFSFLLYLKDTETLIEQFWQKNEKKIKQWYIENKRENDVIISASPEFLLLPMKEKLGVHEIIATRVDINTGKIKGFNCRGEEKIRRFNEKYRLNDIENFYSDSDADIPLAGIAKKAYKVKKNRIDEWKYLG